MDEGDRWRLVGERLAQRREELGISKRAAARRAGVSDSLWGHYEKGVRLVQGANVLPNPSDRNLEAAARAVEMDPRELFDLAGRRYIDRRPMSNGGGPPLEPDRTIELEGRIVRLERRVEEMIQLLRDLDRRTPGRSPGGGEGA